MFQVGDPAPKPLVPLSEETIVGNWESDDVYVSIICPTYQHAGYIEDAISGFLGQKTRFRYEVIIRDDYSTDGTRETIVEYQNAYPRIIRTFLETENRWPEVKPLPILLSAAKGKYIAVCDGDDYWIDDLKLENQVAFMEENNNVSLLQTRAVAVEDGIIFSPLREGGARTFMFPSSVEIPQELSDNCYFSDILLQSLLRASGDGVVMDDITAVWRKHTGGICGGLINKNEKVLNFQRSHTNYWIAQHYYDQGNGRAARRHMVRSIISMMNARPGDKNSILILLYYNALASRLKKLIRTIIPRRLM